MKHGLPKLILEALKRANGYAVPEETLVSDLTNMVRPPADAEDFRDSFLLLSQKDFIGFKSDELTSKRMFFLTEKGEVYLRSI